MQLIVDEKTTETLDWRKNVTGRNINKLARLITIFRVGEYAIINRLPFCWLAAELTTSKRYNKILLLKQWGLQIKES